MQQFDKEKFKTLVLYVIWRTGDVRDFGATKLNKALWFSDARAFEAFGKAVTGETYIREKFGPVPQHVLPALESSSAKARSRLGANRTSSSRSPDTGRTNRQICQGFQPTSLGSSTGGSSI